MDNSMNERVKYPGQELSIIREDLDKLEFSQKKVEEKELSSIQRF